MSPSQIKSSRDQLTMKSISHETPGYWMLVSHDGSVGVAKQKAGESALVLIEIPRKTFAAMVDWYLKDQHVEGSVAR